MVPMVTKLAELRAVRAALDAACRAVGRSAPLPLALLFTGTNAGTGWMPPQD